MQLSTNQSPTNGFFQLKCSNFPRFPETRTFWSHIRGFSIIFSIFFLYSSIFGNVTYIGFYTDLLITLLAATTSVTTMLAAASFHFGMCSYVTEMVTDMSGQLAQIEFVQPKKSISSRRTMLTMQIIEEIQFHVKIME